MHASPPVLTASFNSSEEGRCHRPAVPDQSEHYYIENRQTRMNFASNSVVVSEGSECKENVTGMRAAPQP